MATEKESVKAIETHGTGAERGVDGVFVVILAQLGITFGEQTQAKLTQAALDYASEFADEDIKAAAAKAGK